MNKEEVLQQHRTLIFNMVHKYKAGIIGMNPSYEYKDLVQDGFMVALESILTYKATRSKFITHLYWQLRKHFTSVLSKANTKTKYDVRIKKRAEELNLA